MWRQAQDEVVTLRRQKRKSKKKNRKQTMTLFRLEQTNYSKSYSRKSSSLFLSPFDCQFLIFRLILSWFGLFFSLFAFYISLPISLSLFLPSFSCFFHAVIQSSQIKSPSFSSLWLHRNVHPLKIKKKRDTLDFKSNHIIITMRKHTFSFQLRYIYGESQQPRISYSTLFLKKSYKIPLFTQACRYNAYINDVGYGEFHLHVE